MLGKKYVKQQQEEKEGIRVQKGKSRKHVVRRHSRHNKNYKKKKDRL